jgi:hypothetical protein
MRFEASAFVRDGVPFRHEHIFDASSAPRGQFANEGLFSG